jgi:hypothetical protein
MSDIKVFTVSVVTDASGDFTATTPTTSGKFVQLRYVPDGSNPLDTGADLDIVGTKSGVVLANHDNIGTSAFTRVYRQPTHGVDGSASLYAAAGEPVEAPIYVAQEGISLTISNGGNALAGKFYLYLEC